MTVTFLDPRDGKPSLTLPPVDAVRVTYEELYSSEEKLLATYIGDGWQLPDGSIYPDFTISC